MKRRNFFKTSNGSGTAPTKPQGKRRETSGHPTAKLFEVRRYES